MNNLHLLILNAACDDWENPASIRASVESDPQGAPVESSELEAGLFRLVQQGLLDAHAFTEGAFIRLAPDVVKAEDIPDLWYFTTSAGRRHLDANETFFGESHAP